MRADYHIHTAYCGHARGKVDEYVRAAIQLQMDEICFSDHLFRYYLDPQERKKYWDWCMPEEVFDSYIEDVLLAQKMYPEIKIRLGIEADYIPGKETELEKVLKRGPFDHVIGSIHCIPEFGWSHFVEYKGLDTMETYRLFFKHLVKAAETDLFTSIGHPDFIWRYFPWPEDHREDILSLMEELIDAAAKNKKISIEANANTVLWIAANNPEGIEYFDLFFKRVRKKNVPVTLGSDCHKPLGLAAGFGEMIDMLKCLGFKKSAIFRKKKMKMIKL